MPTQIASVTSRPTPQAGQDHRSSGNFSTQNAPQGTRRFLWKVTVNGAENDTIRFRVKDDRTMAHDPDVFNKQIGNNSETDVVTDRSLYIADPDGAAGQSFLVTVFAV